MLKQVWITWVTFDLLVKAAGGVLDLKDPFWSKSPSEVGKTVKKVFFTVFVHNFEEPTCCSACLARLSMFHLSYQLTASIWIYFWMRDWIHGFLLSHLSMKYMSVWIYLFYSLNHSTYPLATNPLSMIYYIHLPKLYLYCRMSHYTLRRNSSLHCPSSSQSAFCSFLS